MLALTELSPAALADAADENLAAHVSWPHRRTPGMRVVDAPDLLAADSALPCDTFNVVCRARLDPAAAPGRIRAAVALFDGRPFSWWLGPGHRPPELGALLRDAGLAAADTELAMAADLEALVGAGPAPEGLEVLRVADERQLADFARIIAAGWSPPDEQVLRFYALAAPALLDPAAGVRLYLGSLNGEAVATAELAVGGGVAGLYNIVTMAPHRRRGIGTAMTLRPLLDARAAGYRAAVLQASADGRSVYARLGFRPFGEITEYKPAPGR